MGIIYSIDRMDPKMIERIAAEHARDADAAAEPQKARRVLESLGRGDRIGRHFPIESEFDFSLEYGGWNLLLNIAASEDSVDLDKSLDRPDGGIPAVIALLPELRPVGRLLDAMEDFDGTGLADDFHPAEFGLMGIAGSEAIRAAVPVAEEFSRADARERIAAAKPSFLNRLIGNARVLRTWNEDDYLWSNWLEIMRMIREADAADHWLALSLG